MSPKRTIEILAAVALAALPLTTFAQDVTPTPHVEKARLPELAGARFCPRGEATVYVVQCDPGSRAPINQIWMPVGVGLEICTASQPTCQPIPNLNPNARPGFEVMDSAESDLVILGFGLDRLLGVAP